MKTTDKLTFLSLTTLMFLAALLLAPLAALCAAGDELEKNFVKPPAESKPWVWWHWLDGNINKEQITAELEAMHQAGIGGVGIVVLDVGLTHGPIKELSPEYQSLFHFAVKEAGRLGMKVKKNPGDGYSTGGPWITPELGMQRVVFSEAQCEGGKPVDLVIPQPLSRKGYYRDVAVLAYPGVEGENVQIENGDATVTSSVPSVDVKKMFGRNWYVSNWVDYGVGANFGTATAQAPIHITFAFPQPYRARSLTLAICNGTPAKGVLESSMDGAIYQPVVPIDGCGRLTYVFPETTARFYRLNFTSGAIQVSGLELSPRVAFEGWGGKTLAGEMQRPVKYPSPVTVSGADCVTRSAMIDLTKKMTAEGRLSWDAPPGRWTILRIGASAVGQPNCHAGGDGGGLETGHLSAEATDMQWQKFMDPLLADLGPLAGKVLSDIFYDSYECGSQNWTPRFVEEFQKRRGYDPKPFLPVLCNRLVESAEVSERFAWDFRQTIADLWSDNFTKRWTDLCHKHGMIFSIEPYGGGIVDVFTDGGPSDMVMGEFWTNPKEIQANANCRQQVAISHIYGHKVIGAEAFTSLPQADPFIDPFRLKQLGDSVFAQGINNFEIHNFVHQPWENRFPGIKFGGYGINFERTTPWWNQSAAWLRYVASCQYLLRQGLPVVDVCGFPQNGLPVGYSFDECNDHAIRTRMSATDGRIVMPDGMSYRVLTLDNSDKMTKELLRAVQKLVMNGATVIGPKPVQSPSLQDTLGGDHELQTLADEVWGDCDGKSVKEHSYGKGRVVWGKTPGDVLKQAGVSQDFSTVSTTPGTSLLYNHRRTGDADIYFIASRNKDSGSATCTFRVSGKVPELWHPDTGVIETLPIYQEKDGNTVLPLTFDPFDSVFVVFRSPAASHSQRVTSVLRDGVEVAGVASGNTVQLRQTDNGKLLATVREPGAYTLNMADGRKQEFNVEAIPAAKELTGPWELTFPPNWGAPAKVALGKLISWAEHNEPGVRYFSGTASYRKQVECSASELGKGRRIILELGKVKNLAQVVVNGRDCGVVWKEPFSADITAFLHAGNNDLEIRVSNLWQNRMVGDEQLPSDPLRAGTGWKAWPQWLLEGKPDPSGRFTFSSYMPFTKDSPLLESGLLGPVKLRTETWIEL